MKVLFNSNHLYYVESLKNEEIPKVDDHLYHNCISRLSKTNVIKSSFHQIGCDKDFDILFEQILYDVKYNSIFPIIHIECHGNSIEGLLLKNDSYYDWLRLVNILRKINISCKNNLFITFAVCFSHKVFSSISLKLPAPFFGVILSNKEIKNSELIIRYHSFYTQFFLSGNINDSLKVLNMEYNHDISNSLFYFTTEDLFDKTFDMFINKMKDENKFENLFYETINGHQRVNGIKKNRRFNRNFLKDQKKIFPEKIKIIRYRLKQKFCMK